MALQKPVLYAGCLAYAAHIMVLLGQGDKATHDKFHDRAIETLVPLLLSIDPPGNDDALLATAIILRMSEQFSELADDQQHHLRGAQSIITTARDRWSVAGTDIRSVCFWTHVRESIGISILNEEPCALNLGGIDTDLSAADTPEESWTNYTTYLLAKTCSACWGRGNEGIRQAMREQVMGELDRWSQAVPDVFRPWAFVHEDAQPFPVVKYLSSWHGEFVAP